MKLFNIRNSVAALAVIISTALGSIPCSVSAAEEPDALVSKQPTIVITRVDDNNTTSDTSSTYASTTYVDRSGVLSPGQSVSGTFTLTSIFGTNIKVAACADNSNRGSITINFVSEKYTLPGDGIARILYSGTGWSKGTYSYTIYNGSGYETSYAFNVYKS